MCCVLPTDSSRHLRLWTNVPKSDTSWHVTDWGLLFFISNRLITASVIVISIVMAYIKWSKLSWMRMHYLLKKLRICWNSPSLAGQLLFSPNPKTASSSWPALLHALQRQTPHRLLCLLALQMAFLRTLMKKDKPTFATLMKV